MRTHRNGLSRRWLMEKMVPAELRNFVSSFVAVLELFILRGDNEISALQSIKPLTLARSCVHSRGRPSFGRVEKFFFEALHWIISDSAGAPYTRPQNQLKI